MLYIELQICPMKMVSNSKTEAQNIFIVLKLLKIIRLEISERWILHFGSRN